MYGFENHITHDIQCINPATFQLLPFDTELLLMNNILPSYLQHVNDNDIDNEIDLFRHP